jgi:metallophosphoesterase (TIGR00282 family)
MKPFKILFVGDVVGDPGIYAVESLVPQLIDEYQVDFTIINGENAHDGKGINETIVKRFYRSGAQVITGGDHSFDKHLIFPYMAKDRKLLRPINYPSGTPGFGYGVFESQVPDTRVGVINLRGQVFFNNPIRCPFRTIDKVLDDLAGETDLIFVDFHAEASAEKVAMGHYLDGRVSAIVGTHTHIQTADERVLPAGTAYISDVGFTGPHHSVIGMDIQTALNRFLLQIPQKYKLGEGRTTLQGVVISFEPQASPKGKPLRALRVERISRHLDQ